MFHVCACLSVQTLMLIMDVHCIHCLVHPCLRDECSIPCWLRALSLSTMERKTVRPTLELTGIYGGFQDTGIKSTLIWLMLSLSEISISIQAICLHKCISTDAQGSSL